jgi:hypothetical protein
LASKVCKGCGVEKDLREFYAAARNLDGRMGKCKSCVKGSVRENRRNRRQQYAEYGRSRPTCSTGSRLAGSIRKSTRKR